MIRNISTGIDIGSTTIRVVVGEFFKGEKNPRIIGVGESETKGLRHGYVVNIPLVVTSLEDAISMAEKNSGIKIRRAFVSIGGVTLRGETSNGIGIVSKADGEVTNLDINKALEDCEENLNLNNKKIIKVYPTSFKLDGKEILGRPEGMIGTKLEVKALFVTCSNSHFEDLLEVITLAGIDPIDIIASNEAASRISLSEKQKIVGCGLVNIGSETVSLSVFENETLVSLHTFSIGGADITNDIALGMKVSLENAERFKLGNITEDFSKKKLEEIIEARLSDIFELIENHLKKIKRNELLPAGIVFIGGGANTTSLEEFSKSTLKLPSKIGSTEIFGNIKTKLRDPSWFTALGLLIPDNENDSYEKGSFQNILKNIKSILKSNIKQLMP
ncbi:MAG: Cell division protein ftsA [Candidatus Nomurabacteria bacterium GW2011_GWE1_32_28]|uniref:Cell division protein FtsA n=1 Tax=Candidatus Nomurabacteria bacterium GW2011_GWF1_31_48 TaxID=1618767 RepID=A0A0G0BHJ4_9BACT|nr:MAG: Cell division protein ftsA [Candidatus Nomurabacteria bacterium GW2011_GWF2_30_133]KKP29068.1 MAG: Cell division protein ftsA [Candidatus Nomurabacteria bacterium GW2011_GWE2_31_40]KKP30522.1 MAG: Cell division protein ftsA [Candidatus Nomurabacteria bacterium GW2011_GWF1_31_48]KKP35007.1 MAG: Cell division protein ftsA [Candidatus Nomurabacteria bacterium GW2011_GWE1_32_28]HAS80625.1 cell division protein FtsA [Candidatus Nomurabacteria bacterium]